MEHLLGTHLVRNNLHDYEIEDAKVINSKDGCLLIRVGKSYGICEYIMLSYETGRHSIQAPYIEYIDDERVKAHWLGFIDNVKKYNQELGYRRLDYINSMFKGFMDNHGINLTDKELSAIKGIFSNNILRSI